MSPREQDREYRANQLALIESLVQGHGALIGQYATVASQVTAHLKWHDETREFRRRVLLVLLAALMTLIGGVLLTLWTQNRNVAEMRALVEEARQLIRQAPGGAEPMHAGDNR